MSHTTTYTRQAPSYTGGQTSVDPTSYQAWRSRNPYEYVPDQPSANHRPQNANSHVGTLHLVGASDPSATSHNMQDWQFHNAPTTSSSIPAHTQNSMTARHVPPRPMDPSHNTVNRIMKAATSFRPSTRPPPVMAPSSMPATTAGSAGSVPLSKGRTSQWPDLRLPPPPFIGDMTEAFEYSWRQDEKLTRIYLDRQLACHGHELARRGTEDRLRKQRDEASMWAVSRGETIGQLTNELTKLSDEHDFANMKINAQSQIIDDLRKSLEESRKDSTDHYADRLGDPNYMQYGPNILEDFRDGDWMSFPTEAPKWELKAMANRFNGSMVEA